MTLTHEDRNAMLLLPAVRKMHPADAIRRNRAVDKAISRDGYVRDRALLPATNRLDGDDAIGSTDTSSSTSTPKTYMTANFSLPDGIWRVVFRARVTGGLSGAGTLTVSARLNGTEGVPVPITIASSTQMPSGEARVQLDNVPGGSEMVGEVLYLPSAGTATIQCGSYVWRAERMS